MNIERQLDEHLPAVKIMRKFGSNYAFASAIRRTPSTTDRYLVAGYFIGRDVSTLLGDIHLAAKRAGIELTPSDFVDERLFGPPYTIPAAGEAVDSE